MNHVALIRMSWPRPEMFQNRRSHWAAKARVTAAYREEAWGRALEQSVGRIKTVRPRLIVSFHPPDKRRRDLHNMPATIKPAIDGIADAMGCDDEFFRVRYPEEWGEIVKGGCVMIEVRE